MTSWFRRYLLPGFVFQSIIIAGGYGTGRELVEFFLRFGPLGGLLGMLLPSMLLVSLTSMASFEFVRVFETYDYRTFFQRLLGRGWFAYEIGYLSAVLLILAVIRSAAGTFLLETFGLPYWVGVVLLTLVVIVYETVGGMRAVAWTDCVQGIMLLVGLAGLLLAVVPTPAHLADLTAAVAAAAPEKVAVPSWEVSRNWLSTILLIGFSGAVYPHAIQRIYAARDAATLKRAFSVMVFLPLVTTGVMFLVGILAIRELPAGGDPDQVMPALLTVWSTRSTLLYLLCVVVITAVVAAVMSTADSVLLSLSSILAKDVLGTTLLAGAPEERLTRAGKLLSWGVVAVLVVIALSPRVTLWGLTEIKMEILAQVAPLFVLGVTWRRLTTRAAFTGMLAGCATYAGLLLAGRPEVWNVHAGIVGLGVNVAACVALTRLARPAIASSGSPGRVAGDARGTGL